MQYITFTFRDFLYGEHTYCLPAPGGSLKDGMPHTSDQADAYLAEIAAGAKRQRALGKSVIDYLLRRIRQLENQRHFGADVDTKIIVRIRTWLNDLSQ